MDMEDIYEPVGRKSAKNFSAKDYSAAQAAENLLHSGVNVLSADSSS